MNGSEESRPRASLSLDLDNLWAYLRTQGDSSWSEYPSFLGTVIPRMLEFFGEADRTISVFIVGRDIEIDDHARLFERIAHCGHELANHSYSHRIDFHRLDAEAVDEELSTTEKLIESIGGKRPVGFRGPSFRLSPAVLDVLVRRSYIYDASTFPTFVGPLARLFLRAHAATGTAHGPEQEGVFGGWRDGFRSLKPYWWQCDSGRIIELPVTTFPLARVPIHFTYINFIADVSTQAAEIYFNAAMMASRASGTPPSLLLHSTDFIGSEDPACPKFLPGMKRTSEQKLLLLRRLLHRYCERFEVTSLARFAASHATSGMKMRVRERAGSVG